MNAWYLTQYYEEHEEKTSAMRREWEIKQMSRHEKETMIGKLKEEEGKEKVTDEQK